MRTVFFLAGFISAIMSVPSCAEETLTAPNFSDYPVAVYTGKIYIPSYYTKSKDGWRDDMGKEVAPIAVNFSGKYYIGLHSCGAECRYYTLSDLSTGKDFKTLDVFSTDGDQPKKTGDGHTFVTDLISRPDSKAFIARYHIDSKNNSPEECRERFFILSEDGVKITAITKTIHSCAN